MNLVVYILFILTLFFIYLEGHIVNTIAKHLFKAGKKLSVCFKLYAIKRHDINYWPVENQIEELCFGRLCSMKFLIEKLIFLKKRVMLCVVQLPQSSNIT